MERTRRLHFSLGYRCSPFHPTYIAHPIACHRFVHRHGDTLVPLSVYGRKLMRATLGCTETKRPQWMHPHGLERRFSLSIASRHSSKNSTYPLYPSHEPLHQVPAVARAPQMHRHLGPAAETSCSVLAERPSPEACARRVRHVRRPS